MEAPTVFVSHPGPPCTPPIVEGVEFKPIGDGSDLHVGECTEEQAAHFTRIPAFKRHGGSVKPEASQPASADDVTTSPSPDEPPPPDAVPDNQADEAPAGDLPPDDEQEDATDTTDATDGPPPGDQPTGAFTGKGRNRNR